MSVDREALPNVMHDWLTCIECVKRVQVRDAEGWVLVQRSVDEGDPSDDAVFKCPDCATASEEWEAEQRLTQAVGEA
jgi:hypothetical protein